MIWKFIEGMLEGFAFMFKLIIMTILIWLSALPLVCILINGASGWWILTYLLIFPIDYAAYFVMT